MEKFDYSASDLVQDLLIYIDLFRHIWRMSLFICIYLDYVKYSLAQIQILSCTRGHTIKNQERLIVDVSSIKYQEHTGWMGRAAPL